MFILFLSVFLRLYHLNFGLPHSFYADEPEFTELAIKYTYQFRSIIQNNNYFELIPISYVYGTVPTYALTLALMAFSKTLNVLNIQVDKLTIFVFFRSLMVLVSLGVVAVSYQLTKRLDSNTLEQNKLGQIFALLLLAFNYKFIVHAHYVNADIVLTLLLLISFYFFQRYLPKPDDFNLFWSAIFFGLAVGTKITALISLPIYLALIIKKRDLYGVPGFILSALLAFIITNPFSLAFFGDFSYRIYSMLAKEGGMVFDSVDYSPFKYLLALIDMATFPVLGLFMFELITRFKKKALTLFDLFLVTNFVVYVVFFSLQSRRVDRWLLPILPIVLIYAGIGMANLLNNIKSTYIKYAVAFLVFGIYMVKPILVLNQFKRWTPKSEAYIWADKNLPMTSKKLVYTEEGLDPLNKIDFAKVHQVNVYVSADAQLDFPENPMVYDYVIVSSRPMSNFKRPEVVKAYPNYTNAWNTFEQTLLDEKKFELVKDFTLSKPNLIPLSDVFVYHRLQ